jgi:hypothetical protein
MIQALTALYGVVSLCEAFAVNRSRYSEWVPKTGYGNLTEAIHDVTHYIRYYNRVRLYSYNHYQSPEETERLTA